MTDGHVSKTKEVKYFMTKNIVAADENDTILSIAKVMAKKNISCVLVTSDMYPTGIITERDLNKKALAAGLDAKIAPARAIMSKPIIPIHENMDLSEALEMMRKNRVRRLVVTKDDGAVSGIITQTDVTNALYDILNEKVDEIHDLYERTQNLFKDSVKALYEALDQKDHYTGTHCKEVARLAFAMCNELNLPKEEKKNVYLAGLFHDIGKINIADAVLNKQGPLDKDEFNIIKKHPVISETILKPIAEFKDILGIIRHHHEWYNGEGYPDGIRGEKIPLGARIITIVDSYNAMRTNRPYRKAMPKEDALNIIEKMSGKQFDPELAKVFVKIIKAHKLF